MVVICQSQRAGPAGKAQRAGLPGKAQRINYWFQRNIEYIFIYMCQYTYSMYICWYVCMFLLCLPPPQPPYKGGGHRPPAFGGRPPLWIPLYDGWGGGKHSKNIQTYQQMCIEYVYWCIYIYIYIYIYIPYSLGIHSKKLSVLVIFSYFIQKIAWWNIFYFHVAFSRHEFG